MSNIDSVPIEVQRQIVQLTKPNPEKSGDQLLQEFSEILKKIEFSLRAGVATGETLQQIAANVERFERERPPSRATERYSAEAPQKAGDELEKQPQHTDLVAELVGQGVEEAESKDQAPEAEVIVDSPQISNSADEQQTDQVIPADVPVVAQSEEIALAAATIIEHQVAVVDAPTVETEAAPSADVEVLRVLETKAIKMVVEQDAKPEAIPAEGVIEGDLTPDDIVPELKEQILRTAKTAEKTTAAMTPPDPAIAQQQALSESAEGRDALGTAQPDLAAAVRMGEGARSTQERQSFEIFQRMSAAPESRLIVPAILERHMALSAENQALRGLARAEGAVQSIVASKLQQGPLAQGLVRAEGLVRQEERNSRQNEEKSARTLTRGAQARTMERVEHVLKEAVKARDGKTISFRLDPPSLGSLKVDVSLRDGMLHARLVAESGQVAQFLRDRGFELQAVLRSIGLDVQEVRVSVGSQGSWAEEGNGSAAEKRESQGGESAPRMDAEVDDEREGSTEVSAQTVTDHWIA